ncbi:MAG TPA: hypothetical protein VGK32_23025 [Vicinamibacterales bacterium]|jgi:predicted esterase
MEADRKTLRVETVAATTHGRFLVRPPDDGAEPALLLVGLHGYGESAERHMAQLRRIPGHDKWLMVAVQGLHRFYGRDEEVVASWMTREDRELAIADNVAYVDAVVAAVRRRHGAATFPVFLGFSQGVAMAFRAAVLGAAGSAGIVALGGDIPPEVRGQPAASFAHTLIARGERDTWYTAEKMDADENFLRSIACPFESLTFDGGHEWTDDFRRAAGQFLAGLAG